MQTTTFYVCDRATGLPKRKEIWNAALSLAKDFDVVKAAKRLKNHNKKRK